MPKVAVVLLQLGGPDSPAAVEPYLFNFFSDPAIIGAPPPIRTPAWVLFLVWMGAACLANARRCGRTHCHLTGPFFLVMAAAVLAHGAGLLPLGRYGWAWLGATTAAGAALLWSASEALLGRYLPRRARSP